VKKQPNLDLLFEALASVHRREIIASLALQPYSIGQLAGMRKLSLPAIHKHIKILEAASLIARRKIGRTNLTINRSALKGLQEWLTQYQTHWGSEAESLANYESFLAEKSSNQSTSKAKKKGEKK
jgi:DNA-binding transcriptional ArsR family regulator